jgi:uncharacterized protein YecT (DUF1311 family)
MQQKIIPYFNKLVSLNLLILITSCSQGLESNDSSNNDESQVEMNLNAEQEYISTKHVLDSIFEGLLVEYSKDDEIEMNIRASQEAWIHYRDAQLLMKYPESDPLREGSVFNTCYFSYMTELSKERITTLIPWLDGAKEGEVCSGSIKIR